MATQISTDDFEKDLPAGKCLVKATASWCGPCQVLTPTLKTISEETGVPVFELDVDEHTIASQRYGIRSVPTVILFCDQKATDVAVGVRNKQFYVEMVSK